MVEKNDVSIFPEARVSGIASWQASRDRPPTEFDLADECEQRWGDKRLFDHARGRWLSFDRGVWRPQHCGEVLNEVMAVFREMGFAKLQTYAKAKAVEAVLRTRPGLSVTSDRFDCADFMLGTPEGVIDLRTGEFLPPDPRHLVSKMTSVGPDFSMTTPNFNTFLEDITNGDQGLKDYLQKAAGYCLTGDTSEQIVLFLHGRGGNGKGVFVRLIAGCLGEYAHRAEPETFVQGFSRHPTEIAAMHGARLVYCSETERNVAWAQGRLKDLTGGDKLRGRFVHQDGFEFQPRFKLVFSGNFEPSCDPSDDALRRRLVVISFSRQFLGEEIDKKLESKLYAEMPGIMAWLIKGCLAWKKSGLELPQCVRQSTAVFFQRQDTFSHWLEDATEQGPDFRCGSKALFASWKRYVQEAAEHPGTLKSFAERMRRAGFGSPYSTTLDGKKLWCYRGLRLIESADSEMLQLP